MLLGYIFEVVKNQSVAEQYLVSVFNDVPNELDEITKPGVNALCRLQMMARKKLTIYFETLDDGADPRQRNMAISNNKFIALMSAEQQQVFCGVHYQCKTITKLAAELNKPEDTIKKTLKECFTIIRSGRDYAGLH